LGDQDVGVTGTGSGEVVLGWLGRLDRMLYAALTSVGEPPAGPGDPLRGLHVSHQDAVGLLEREVCAVHPVADDLLGAAVPPPAGGLLAARYGLSDFDLDVLMVALAPEVDLRYQRIYAYLHDDITRRCATVDLALTLLCATPAEKLARRVHFAADRPLVGGGLVRLVPEPGQVHVPLLAHQVAVDPQIVDTLLGGAGVDHRLASWCTVSVPAAGLDGLPWVDPEVRAAAGAAVTAGYGGHAVRVYLRGQLGSGRRTVAGAIAGEIGRPLLRADLAAAPSALDEFTGVLAVLFREAFLFGAVLYVVVSDQQPAKALPQADLQVLLIPHPSSPFSNRCRSLSSLWTSRSTSFSIWRSMVWALPSAFTGRTWQRQHGQRTVTCAANAERRTQMGYWHSGQSTSSRGRPRSHCPPRPVPAVVGALATGSAG
jgi:hypothetical protein